MSHVTDIKCPIDDLAAVKAVCAELGLTFCENQNRYRWYGSHVGDYPLPDGFTVEDLGKCVHAIKVPGCDWEIGLSVPRNGKGLRMLFDFWGPGQALSKALGGNDAREFVARYEAVRAERACAKAGYRTTREKAQHGYNVIATGRF